MDWSVISSFAYWFVYIQLLVKRLLKAVLRIRIRIVIWSDPDLDLVGSGLFLSPWICRILSPPTDPGNSTFLLILVEFVRTLLCSTVTKYRAQNTISWSTGRNHHHRRPIDDPNCRSIGGWKDGGRRWKSWGRRWNGFVDGSPMMMISSRTHDLTPMECTGQKSNFVKISIGKAVNFIILFNIFDSLELF